MKKTRVNKTENKQSFKLLINATLVYILAYLLIYVMHQVATVFVAWDFWIDSKVLYYTISFLSPRSSPLWSFDATVSVFLAGPIISLLLGMIFLTTVNWLTKYKPHLLNLFFIWCFLHGFNFFFGGFIDGILTNTGSSYVAKIMELSEVIIIDLIIIAVYLMFLIGGYSSKIFILYSRGLKATTAQEHFRLFTIHFVLPWLIGSTVLILYKAPQFPLNELLIHLTMIIFLGPALYYHQQLKKSNVPVQPIRQHHRIRWELIALVIATLAVIRFGLDEALVINNPVI
ncbi:MAG: hypothetical protein K9I94_00725 [Bacteroidales bacterium]|nr:hypothetical protein [Bacteroidales bacterium]